MFEIISVCMYHVTGAVTTVAGGGAVGTSVGSGDGVGTAALFRTPMGIIVTSNGILFVSDYSNNIIRKIQTVSPTGRIYFI